MKKWFTWYMYISSVLILLCILLVGLDVFTYTRTGEFVLFRSLNTVPMETIDESWNYVVGEDLALWGTNEWAQRYIPHFFVLSFMNAAVYVVLYISKLHRQKACLTISIVLAAVCLLIFAAYLSFISGSVSEIYIRNVIM